MERENLIATVTAAQGGDHGAMNKLFSSYYNDVYYFALKTVKSEDLACDITQETFIEVINTLGALQEPAAFVSWLKKIAYHQCTRFFKKKTDILVDEDDEGNTVFDTLAEDRTEFIPDEALDQQDFRNTILGILDELSEEQRAATILYYYDELSVGQIAHIQNVSEGTVKSRLNYARKSIKKSVESYEKKNGIKLHCAGVLPLMLWLLAGQQKETMPAPAVKAAAQGIRAATGVALRLPKAAGVAGLLAKLIALPLAVRVIVPVAAAALIIGAAVVSTPKKPADPAGTETPTYSTQGSIPNQSSNSTQGSTAPTDVTVPSTGTTDPTQESTEPTTGNTTPSINATTPSTEATTPGTEATAPSITANYVPNGCVYVLTDGTKLSAGEQMPEIVSVGDQLLTADYIYEYLDEDSGYGSGWGVVVQDNTKSSYENLLSLINDKPVVYVIGTFYGCTEMTEAPALPDTVKDISMAFWYCSALTAPPAIPSGVTDMFGTFYGCSAMQQTPYLPDSVTDMIDAFAYCTSITSVTNIPSKVENLLGAFTGCVKLTHVPELPNTVVKIGGAFEYCSSLVTAPAIPGGITDLSNLFSGCSSLTTAPTIPEGVTDISGLFSGCSSLTTAPTIPKGVTDISDLFNGCTALTAAPVIPGSVTNMKSAFYNCTALTGHIQVNAVDLATWYECFAGTRLPIALLGTSEDLYHLADTSAYRNVSVGLDVITASGIVPEGYRYITAQGVTLNAGENMPDVCTNGDRLVSSVYTYKFGTKGIVYGGEEIQFTLSSHEWYLEATDKTKTTYPAIFTVINGQYVDSLAGAFEDCANMVTAPAIPEYVKDLSATFSGCAALKEAPSIPGNVTRMYRTFENCSNIVAPPEIPESVTMMRETFRNCTSLTSRPQIPTSVTDSTGIFDGCSLLAD